MFPSRKPDHVQTSTSQGTTRTSTTKKPDRPAEKYESFLLVIAYGIGPWLGVVFTDQLLRRGHRAGGGPVDGLLFDPRHHNWAGPVAMLVGMVVSIGLFSYQSEYVGLVPRHYPAVGDVTFAVGFVLAAGLCTPCCTYPGRQHPRRTR